MSPAAITPTAIPAVKAAIEGRLVAALDVPVHRGKIDPAPEEYVSIFKAEGKREFAAIRGGAPSSPLKELIDVELIVSTLVVAGEPGEGEAAAEARGYEIFTALEAALRADLTLGGAWQFDRISKVADNFWRTDHQYGCWVFATVSGNARI